MQRDDNDHCIQHQIYRDQHHGDTDRFLETLQKDCAQHRQQNQCHGHLAGQPMRSERVVDEMRSCVGSRKRHGDDEVGRRKSQQNQDESFPAPPGK